MNEMLKRWACASALALCLAGGALAAQPEDAIAPPPAESVWGLLRLEDAGAFLRWALTKEKLELVAPMADLDAATISLLTLAASNVPVEAAVLLSGSTGPEPAPFMQAALAVPGGAEMDRLAGGQGTANDVMALLLGAESPLLPMFDGAFELTSHGSGVYEIPGAAWLAAHEGLLVVGLSREGLDASLKALYDADGRLTLPRRFATQDLAFLHVDVAVSEALSRASAEEGQFSEEDYKALRAALKAPLEVEMGFEALKDRFLLSLALNVEEALSDAYAKHLEAMAGAPLVKGGHIALFGEGSPLFALGTWLNVAGIAEGPDPALRQAWRDAMEAAAQLSITEDEMKALLSGGLSLTAGGDVIVEAFKVPGLALSMTGRDGVAKTVLDKVMKLAAEAFSAVQIEGWDAAFQADPSAIPVPCVGGTKGEMLIAALGTPATLGGSPAPYPALAELLDQESIGSLFIDFAAAHSFLKAELSSFMPLISMALGEAAPAVQGLLDAELSIPTLSAWSPSFGVCCFSFEQADVAPGKGLLPKIIELAMALDSGDVEGTEESTEEDTVEDTEESAGESSKEGAAAD